MRLLNWEFKQLGERHRDGSYATQHDRARVLSLVGKQLAEMGLARLTLRGMKPKHIDALVRGWLGEGLSAGTIKNRMAHLRWVAEKIGKQNIVARSNDCYGIADRIYVTNISKARELKEIQLDKIVDPYTRISLKFQAAFGLRREESLKLRPGQADQGDRLSLKASWCKGRKARDIPILTLEQRQLLDEAKVFAKGGSLIPFDLSYKEHLRTFRTECERGGIHKVHGHRHWYAQKRYHELTGWECPSRGGPVAKQLTPEQKQIDRAARMSISHELGHEREQITAVYLGR